MTNERAEDAGPRLRSISPDAGPDEVAAIVAAVAAVDRRRRTLAASGTNAFDPHHLDHWRESSRLSSRRIGMTRGPWRLSGRLTRRSRA